MPDPPDIAPAEWKVMRLLWRRAPLPAANIIKALAEREDWHPNTIKTLLARLVRKRALGARRHQGRCLTGLRAGSRRPLIRTGARLIPMSRPSLTLRWRTPITWT